MLPLRLNWLRRFHLSLLLSFWFAASLAAAEDGLQMGAESQSIYFEVTLNAQATGKLLPFTRVGESLFARVETLTQLGLRLPEGTPDPVNLSQWSGVSVEMDVPNLQLAITVPPDYLNRATSVLNRADRRALPATSMPSLVVNYDFFATADDQDSRSLSNFTDLRLRVPNDEGQFSSSFLAQAHDSPLSIGDQQQVVRLDSFYQRSFQEQALTLTVGDSLSGALNWSRPTRMAGVQFGSDFALQPDQITTPIPSFFGQVTTPSRVELYVDGIRRYTGEVNPGAFELYGSPTISGSGNAQVVLTDALGRATTLTFPFYNSEQLMTAGLSDWSAALGVVRLGYGQESAHYAEDPAVNASLRYGVSDGFTLKLHGEAVDGLALAGMGSVVSLGDYGIAQAAFAQSSHQGGVGALTHLGYSWRSRGFNFSAESTRSFAHWQDIASRYGSPAPRVSDSATVGFPVPKLGSLGVGYLHLRFPQESGSEFANAFWSNGFGPTTVSLSANQNLRDDRDRSIFLGFTWNLAERTQFSTSVQDTFSNTSGSLGVSKSASVDGGLGWRLQAQASDTPSIEKTQQASAELDYLGRYGELRLGARETASTNQIYGDVSGALVVAQGRFFASQRVNDAFAIVSTNDIPNVPITLSNRVVGTTDEAGMLLVPHLNAWQANELGFDSLGLPADVQIKDSKIIAVPRAKGGTPVQFEMRVIRSALVVLTDPAGQPLPVGSRVRLVGQPDSETVVGYDGIAYLESLGDQNQVEVDTEQGRCRLHFEFKDAAHLIPQIGPFICQPESAP